MSEPMTTPCAFCALQEDCIVTSNTLAIAIRDGFPVSPGHTLIILRRHIATLFNTTTEERLAMFALTDSAKHEIDTALHPSGYNIGVNDGPGARQTILHLHIHLIPRYTGDAADPRGGVRWIFPDKAAYWTK